MPKTLRLALSVLVFCPASFAALEAQTEDDAPTSPMTDCRETQVAAADGRVATVRYCRNQFGQLIKVGGTELPDAPFPPQASINYRGSYQGTNHKPGPPLRRLDLNQILKSAGTTTETSGNIQLSLTVSGTQLQGTARTDGSYWTANITGKQSGGRCRMASEDGTITVEGVCSDRFFRGKIEQRRPNGHVFSASFNALAQ